MAGAAALAAGAWWVLFRSPLSRPPAEEAVNRRRRPGTLRYRVPDHQDPAVLVAALKLAGFGASAEWGAGAHHLTISCPDLRSDRPRVRSVIESTTASSLSGAHIIHVQARFEDEQR